MKDNRKCIIISMLTLIWNYFVRIEVNLGEVSIVHTFASSSNTVDSISFRGKSFHKESNKKSNRL